MGVREKSIYDPPAPDDGHRVLTTNYWPRGISLERAGTYVRALAPTRGLLRAFKDGEIDWPAYRERYLAEMQGDEQRRLIGELAAEARRGVVTVMCVCRETEQCHRFLLRTLIEQAMAEAA